MVTQNHKGVLLMAGCAPQAVCYDFAMTYWGAFHGTLKAVAAPEGNDIVVSVGEIQTSGQGFFQLYSASGLIFDNGIAGNGVTSGKYGVYQRYRQMGHWVL